jgi:hypothetical protein
MQQHHNPLHLFLPCHQARPDLQASGLRTRTRRTHPLRQELQPLNHRLKMSTPNLQCLQASGLRTKTRPRTHQLRQDLQLLCLQALGLRTEMQQHQHRIHLFLPCHQARPDLRASGLRTRTRRTHQLRQDLQPLNHRLKICTPNLPCLQASGLLQLLRTKMQQHHCHRIHLFLPCHQARAHLQASGLRTKTPPRTHQLRQDLQLLKAPVGRLPSSRLLISTHQA